MTEKAKAFWSWILDRLSENSTWRGLILAATALGLQLEPEQWDKILTAGLALVAAINVFRVAPPSQEKVKELGDATRGTKIAVLHSPKGQEQWGTSKSGNN